MRQTTIRFADDLCVYHPGAVLDIEGVTSVELWFQYSDLQRSKRKALVLAKEAGQYGLGSLLTNTYGKTDTGTMEAITAWAVSSAARRGLERFINKEYAAKRIDIRRRTIKSVITAQRKMREEGIEDTEYTSKVLGKLSEAFSQDSSRFARVMGLADHEATVVAHADLGASSARDDHDSVRKAIERTDSPHTVLELSSLSLLTGGRSSTNAKLPLRRNFNVAHGLPRGASEMRHYY